MSDETQICRKCGKPTSVVDMLYPGCYIPDVYHTEDIEFIYPREGDPRVSLSLPKEGARPTTECVG